MMVRSTFNVSSNTISGIGQICLLLVWLKNYHEKKGQEEDEDIDKLLEAREKS